MEAKNPKKRKSRCYDDIDLLSFKQKKLPENFADKVLNLELEMESDYISLESVNQLVELYATAVEYYEYTQSNRYLIFEKKLHNLLMNSNVIKAMNSAASPELKSQQKKKDHDLNIKSNLQDTDSDVKRMLNSVENDLQTISNLMNLETNKQKDDIAKRLAERKLKKEQNPFSPDIKKQKENDQSQNILDNITKIIKKRESITVGGKIVVKGLDTDSFVPSPSHKLDIIIENKIDPFNEMKRKSIAILKRDSRCLNSSLEKRNSRISMDNSSIHSKSIFNSKIGSEVIEEKKQNESEESSEDESISMASSKKQKKSNLSSNEEIKNKIEIIEKQVDIIKEPTNEIKEIPTIERSVHYNTNDQHLIHIQKKSISNVENKNEKEDIQIQKDSSNSNLNKLNVVSCENEKRKSSFKKNFEEKKNIDETKNEKKINELSVDQEKNDNIFSKQLEKEKNENLENQEKLEKNDHSEKIKELANIEKNNEKAENIEKNEKLKKIDKHDKEDKIMNKSHSELNDVLKKSELTVLSNSIKNEPEETQLEAEKMKKEEKLSDINKERDEKIKAIKNKFAPQIANLEIQSKASKGKGLISKLLDKMISEEAKQIEQIMQEYSLK